MTSRENEPHLAAKDAIFREVVKQINDGVTPEGLHHLAEAYALASVPSRSSTTTVTPRK